ncbi:MAG: hypothetical protein QG612_1140 [Pseudomonadota bacterium]|nr:hypothetical protein [Pseudomonadota bacterium]
MTMDRSSREVMDLMRDSVSQTRNRQTAPRPFPA